MRYLVRKSIVRVVGRIWQPGIVASMVYTLREYDIDNMRKDAEFRNGSPEITREIVDLWLGTHAGDFQTIDDFDASIEDGDKTLDFPFASEDGEMAYGDTLAEAE